MFPAARQCVFSSVPGRCICDVGFVPATDMRYTGCAPYAYYKGDYWKGRIHTYHDEGGKYGESLMGTELHWMDRAPGETNPQAGTDVVAKDNRVLPGQRPSFKTRHGWICPCTKDVAR